MNKVVLWREGLSIAWILVTFITFNLLFSALRSHPKRVLPALWPWNISTPFARMQSEKISHMRKDRSQTNNICQMKHLPVGILAFENAGGDERSVQPLETNSLGSRSFWLWLTARLHPPVSGCLVLLNTTRCGYPAERACWLACDVTQYHLAPVPILFWKPFHVKRFFYKAPEKPTVS